MREERLTCLHVKNKYAKQNTLLANTLQKLNKSKESCFFVKYIS